MKFLLAFLMVLVWLMVAMASPALAQSRGATYAAEVAAKSIFDFLKYDPVMMAAVILGACVILSKVLKIDLTKYVWPILSSLLAPPGTPQPVPPVITQPVPPVTVPPVVVSPSPPPSAPILTTLTPILEILMNLLVKAKSRGDKDQEAALMKVIENLS